MEYKNSSDIIQNNKNQKIYATIKDIEKINLQWRIKIKYKQKRRWFKKYNKWKRQNY